MATTEGGRTVIERITKPRTLTTKR